jgi:hypothetical protein
MIYELLPLLAYLTTNIIWLSLMITLILCGLFLCALNLTFFLLCQKKSLMSPHSLPAPSKPSSATMAYLYTSPQNGKVERILRTINNMLHFLFF